MLLVAVISKLPSVLRSKRASWDKMGRPCSGVVSSYRLGDTKQWSWYGGLAEYRMCEIGWISIRIQYNRISRNSLRYDKEKLINRRQVAGLYIDTDTVLIFSRTESRSSICA